MSRWRPFLSNPYKVKAVRSRVFRPVLTRWMSWRLRSIKPGTIHFLMNGMEDPSTHFLTRPHPLFFFDPSLLDSVPPLIPADRLQKTLDEAQKLAEGVFAFRNSPPVHLGIERIDWRYNETADPDWNADLLRLDWLNTLLFAARATGNHSYAQTVADVLLQWVEANGPGTGAWRDPFEVAQRCNTLCWTLFWGLPFSEVRKEALRAILCIVLASGLWTEAALEFHAPNNHLLLASLRLAQLGILFPEFKAAGRWREKGALLLHREIVRQVLPDGVHAERSTFYQRMVFEGLLEYIALCRRNNLAVPSAVLERGHAMLSFLEAIQRKDGSFPIIGDGYDSDVLLRYDLVVVGNRLLRGASHRSPRDPYSICLLNGSRGEDNAGDAVPPGASAESRFWLDGGYGVLHTPGTGRDSSLLFDFGPFGMAPAPGHGHSDCLSVQVSVLDRPFLIDPGSYSWSKELVWRNAFRGTRAHNTLMVDGMDQTPLQSFFGVGRPAKPRLHHAVIGERLALIDASHDGYMRLKQGVIHRRSVIACGLDGWLVVDQVFGKGRARIEVFWHFDPSVSVRLGQTSCLATDVRGASLLINWETGQSVQPAIRKGATDPLLGWTSKQCNYKEPADVLVLSGEVGLPARLVTALAPLVSDRAKSCLQPLVCDGGIGGSWETDRGRTVYFLGFPGVRGGMFGRWSTDGEAAIAREGDEPAFLLASGRWIAKDGLEVCGSDPGTERIVAEQRRESL